MANNIIISYDLCQSGQNYDDVIKYIQSYTVYCKINQSVWYVKTDKIGSAFVMGETYETENHDIRTV